jgi:hypothetical protein
LAGSQHHVRKCIRAKVETPKQKSALSAKSSWN